MQSNNEKKQLSVLKQEWGENFDEVYAAVEERFKKLPPEKQAVLNNPSGALLLAKVIAEERKLNASTVATPKVEKSTVSPAPEEVYKFKLSELIQMRKTDPKKYYSMASVIDEAYAAGQVDRNS